MKVIQLVTTDNSLMALCDDGSIWRRVYYCKVKDSYELEEWHEWEQIEGPKSKDNVVKEWDVCS